MTSGLATNRRPKPSPRSIAAHNGLLFAFDVMSVACAGAASASFCGGALGLLHLVAWETAPILREVLLGSILVALVLREPDLANRHDLLTPSRLLARLSLRAATATGILLAIGLATRGLGDGGRAWLFLWCTMILATVGLTRLALILYLRGVATEGGLQESVAVIGAPDVAARVAARLAETVAVVRVIDDCDPFEELAEFDDDFPASEAFSELLELACNGNLDTVIVALDASASEEAPALLRHLQAVPVEIAICRDSGASALAPRKLRVLGNVSMAIVARRPPAGWEILAKAIMDKLGALLLLVATCPILLLAVVAISLESRGEVIFRQQRSGWGGRPFTIYKLRTMRQDGGYLAGRQTDRNDPRCTRVGSILRRTSIDELPQLWNVLRGDMSLIGPRPHADVLHKVERAGCAIVAEYARRQRVKPGVTGWAQIHGMRGAVRTQEAMSLRLAYDLYYIEHWSIWLDIAILLRTPIALVSGRNAY